MAVIWRRDYAGKHYEVRRAGSSLRLYTNGAFHSQYNPRHLFTGAVWDLLTLPALFNPALPRTALLLGLGGGTAIHQLRRLVPECRITAVELDPIHIQVALNLFRVDADNLTMVEADAVAWARRERRRFDLVIDDLFLDAPDDPQRPAPVDEHWLERLAARTGARGLLVQNHLSTRQVFELLDRHGPLLEKHFASALVFATPKYENGMLALYRQRIDPPAAEVLARDRITLADRRGARKLRFAWKQLF